MNADAPLDAAPRDPASWPPPPARPWTRLLLCLASSALLFALLAVTVRRPLVVGEIQRQLDFKLARAEALGSPKLVVLAGSNGRYSHACAPLAQALALPCVNASVGVGIALDFQFALWLPRLGPGDVVLLPLEYGQYRASSAQMRGGLHPMLMLHHHPDRLWQQGPQAVWQALAAFDLHQLVHGLGETALHAAGVTRRSSLASLTPEGDQRGHDARAAAAHAAALARARAEPTGVPDDSDALRAVRQFLRDAAARGARVVGSLPTIPDDVPLEPATVERLRALYERAGQHWVQLPGLSRYPRHCFYDTLYHLREACQQQHSEALGDALGPVLGATRDPAPPGPAR
jgi:hypothetical protein